MLFCNKCGKQLADEANFCNICGAKVVRQVLICRKCGKQLPEGSNFCNICGCPINGSPEEVKPAVSETPKTVKYKSALINPDLPVVAAYDQRYGKTPFSAVSEAAKTGDISAIFELAERYNSGSDGVEKDLNKAVGFYKEILQKQNNILAFLQLGSLIADKSAYGDDRRVEGIQYYEAAFELGNDLAAFSLGNFYLDGIIFPKDENKAWMYMKEAVRLSEDGELCYIVGDFFNIYQKYPEARDAFEKAMNYPEVKLLSAAKLAKLYEFGAEGVNPDPAKALKLYEMVYANKDSDDEDIDDAAFGIARILFDKKTGKGDPERAFKLFTEDGKKGNKRSNYYLGYFYWKGIPNVLTPDIPTAIRYLSDVESSKEVDAAYSLGVIYYVNLHEMNDAVKYLSEASKKGNGDAKKLLEKISRENRLNCRKCGAAIRIDSKFCGKCGTPIENAMPAAVPAAPEPEPSAIFIPADQTPAAAQPAVQSAAQVELEPPRIKTPADRKPASQPVAAQPAPAAQPVVQPAAQVELEPPKTKTPTVAKTAAKPAAQAPSVPPKKEAPVAAKPVQPDSPDLLKLLASATEKSNAGMLDEAREVLENAYSKYPEHNKVIDSYIIFLANELSSAWDNGTEGSDKTKNDCELVLELAQKLRKNAYQLEHADQFENAAHCTLGRYYNANGKSDLAMQEWKKTDVMFEPYAAYHIYEIHKKMAKRSDDELKEKYNLTRKEFEKEHVSDVELLKKALNSEHFSNKQEKAWIYLALASHYTSGSTYIAKDLGFAYECVQNARDLGSKTAVNELTRYRRNVKGELEYNS
jgi:TPR repeat protein